MSRPPKAERTRRVEVQLPESLYHRLVLLLVSPTEGRIPQGDLSKFYVTLTEQALARLASNA
jgi:hypothetical protein